MDLPQANFDFDFDSLNSIFELGVWGLCGD
jgi:hypothetical protein